MQRLNNEHNNLKRLIKIARPVDLMPLHTETKKPDNSVKKTLALFGKRGTFSTVYSTVTKEPKCVKPIQSDDNKKSDEEEVEENDEKEAPTDDKTILDDEQIKKPSTSAGLIRSPSESIEENEEPKVDQTSANERTKIPDAEDDSNSTQRIATTNESTSNSSSNTNNTATTKKKRNRVRIRSDKGRENVDIDFDEEIVDTEKYSTWVPPQGQSGDGSTDLNKKYGY